MTKQKDLKRIIRSRMAKTGESYTAARRVILSRKEGEGARASSGTVPVRRRTAPAQEAPGSFAALAGMSDEAVKAKTGCTWKRWVGHLDHAGANEMSHREIVEHILARFGIDGWWAQMVTVGYERIRGLRAKGQRRSGAWEASKSRTFAVPVATLFDAFANAAKRKRWLDGVKLKVRTSTRPKSMRIGWEDGTTVSLWFTDKGTKSQVAVQHLNLSSKEDAERMKEFWSEKLGALAAVL
ncbi:MAG TPA: hypothetical protein VNL91_11285 [Thermoanaerobaculia bacterium]|nr:hypothetical protein [Thermoanaerobaculia bacterium]